MSDNYESLLCAALLAAPEMIDAVPVSKDAFKDSQYRVLYEVLCSLRQEVVSDAALVQELQNRQWTMDAAIRIVGTLVGVYPDPPGIDVIEALAAKVNDSYGKRCLSDKITSLLREVRDPVVEFTDNISRLSTIAVEAQLGAVVTTDPTATGIHARIEQRKASGEITVFPSGLPLIDQCLASRGIKRGQIWFVVGPYKAYKTRVVVHICNTALAHGKVVSYFGLEDDDITFTTALMAAAYGIPEGAFDDYYENKYTRREAQIKDALMWLSDLGPQWVVHDQAGPAGDWRRFLPTVLADKTKYGTDLVIVDHVQAWGEDYKILGEINPILMRAAAQAKVAIVVLSQVSNETMKLGPAKSQLATKGSGSFGALAHVGIEVMKDHENSDLFLEKRPDVRARLEVDGTLPLVNKRGEVSEVALKLKVVRKGKSGKTFYGLFDAYSGKLLCMYDRPYVLQGNRSD